MECKKCGVCCIAPDISTLNKPKGLPCKYLTPDFMCSDYENRPRVCREYKPCDICNQIYHPEIKVRIERYNKLFDI